MRARWLGAILPLAVLGAFLAPAAATGMLLVEDEPVPHGWGELVDAGRGSLYEHVDGVFGLRFARMDCRPGGGVVVWFEMRGPFAPGTAAVVMSEAPWHGSDAGWRGGIASEVGRDPDAEAFLGAHASGC